MVSVETARLLLRPIEGTDLPAYTAMRAKPQVVQFLPGGPARAGQSGEAAQKAYGMFRDCWLRDGYGPWAVEEKATATFRGHLGLRKEAGETELLYMLDDTVWGRGYATEGGQAALRYGFDTLKLDRIVAWVLPENAASLRVTARLGMVREPGLRSVFGLSAVEARITRTQWLAGQAG